MNIRRGAIPFLLLIGFLLQPLFADELPKRCNNELSGAANKFAQQAHALGRRLDFNKIRGYLKRFTGAEPLTSGITLEGRDTKEMRAATREEIIQIALDLGYTQIELEPVADGANVIIESPGTTRDNEVFELNAHYDTNYTGADDNTSGVALLLTMLEIFKNNPHERRVRFVFADLEERGFLGTAVHVTNMLKNPDQRPKFLGALVVDMIGWANLKSKKYLGVFEFGDDRHHRRGTYPSQLAFAKELYFVLSRIGTRDHLVLSPEREEAKPSTTDLGRYWNYSFPAILVSAPYEPGFINPNYHRPTDTIATMNEEYYRYMAEAIVEMSAYMARTEVADVENLSPREWQILGELENHNVTEDNFELPASAERSDSLDRCYMINANRRRRYLPMHDAIMDHMQNLKEPTKVLLYMAPDIREGTYVRRQADIKMGNFVYSLRHESKRALAKIVRDVTAFGGQAYRIKAKEKISFYPRQNEIFRLLENGVKAQEEMPGYGVIKFNKIEPREKAN